MEPNDILLLAELVELDPLSPVVIASELGDNPDVDANDDVDLYEIELITGDLVSFDIDARSIDSNLNSVLTLFNTDGTVLDQNNNISVDGVTDFDSFLEFTVPQDGIFYVGVSSARNLNYDPNEAGSGSGNSSGIYNLTFTLEREVDGSEPNDTIALAEIIQFDDSSFSTSGEIGDNPDVEANNDVDLYAVELSAGDTIFVDIDAELNGSDLDSVVSIFSITGDLLVQNDDNSFENQTEPDSFQQFTALINGTYYVGISSSENINYNPNEADSGEGNSSGTYDLTIRLEAGNTVNELYSEPNDTILLANTIELTPTDEVSITGEIGDNPALTSDNNDVDLFEIELNEGSTLSADINAHTIGSNLNSVLTIFDAEGNLLAQNDDNAFDDVVELDPFLAFTAPEDGAYYLGVSSSENLEYDPTTADSGEGDSIGAYLLKLTVEENLFTTPITRFQNNTRPGTYLFSGPEESQVIRDNFPNFDEEGIAFKVSTTPEDSLIRFNRFQNLDVPGTYLYAGEEESISIRANFPNFFEEGIAFYTYGASSDAGVEFYRLQNLAVPGTYIFVAEEERNGILANFPNFFEEGIAFKVET